MADEKKPELHVMPTPQAFRKLADDLDRAKRFIHSESAHPAPAMPFMVDEPEGTIYILMSDTLAKLISTALRIGADELDG